MHLLVASRNDELVRTTMDLRYLATKTLARTATAVEADLINAELQAPADMTLRALRRNFVQCGHLLNRCEESATLQATLYSRLQFIEDLAPVTRLFAEHLTKPRLEAKYALPDLPHPALIRTLSGHAGAVLGCSISVDGTRIVSAGTDRLLKVWEVNTWTRVLDACWPFQLDNAGRRSAATVFLLSPLRMIGV